MLLVKQFLRKRRSNRMDSMMKLLTLLITSSTAKYMEGDLNSGENWVFIAR